MSVSTDVTRRTSVAANQPVLPSSGNEHWIFDDCKDHAHSFLAIRTDMKSMSAELRDDG